MYACMYVCIHLEGRRVLAEAERVEAELARYAAILEHLLGGDLEAVRPELDGADADEDLDDGGARDLEGGNGRVKDVR
jgi:hypothetical protein